MGSFSIRSRSSLSLATGRRSVGEALRRPRPPRDGSVVPRALPCPDCMRALKRDSRNSAAASSSALSSELVPLGCAHLFLSPPLSRLAFQASLELPWCPSTCLSRCVRDTGRGGEDVAAPGKPAIPPLCCFACASFSRVCVCLPDSVTCKGRTGQAGGRFIAYICVKRIYVALALECVKCELQISDNFFPQNFVWEGMRKTRARYRKSTEEARLTPVWV